jgi:hypothetical protein
MFRHLFPQMRLWTLECSMRLLIRSKLEYTAAQPCDLLLQIEAFSDDEQHIVESRIEFDADSRHHSIAGEEGIGTRRWVTVGPKFECHYDVQVDISRKGVALDALSETERTQIPSTVIKYLMPSRYCHPEQFLEFVSVQFGNLSGGALIAAMSKWINTNFTYDNASSNAGTTATDSFNSLTGVCRDYAHMLITLARAAGIPARFVGAYAPGVVPQDFHAVVEVYLDGAWHLVDATGMAKPSEIVRVCVGRDAADASFMTSYGWMDLVTQSVEVRRIPA